MANIAPLDLVQLRWQQIRVMETSQVTERENISLKKQLQEVRSKSSKIGSETLNKFIARVKDYILKNKTDVGKLKLMCVQQINSMLAEQSILKRAVGNLLAVVQEKDLQLLDGRAEVTLLTAQLAEARQNTVEALRAQEVEMGMLRGKIERLKVEKVDLQHRNETITGSYNNVQRKCEELTAARDKADAKLESAQNDLRRQLAAMARAEEAHQQEVAELRGVMGEQTESFEKRLTEWQYENQYLRTIIAEQEEQIQRLSNALIGNKSHFAKFVEVKTENLTLQAKLDAVAKSNNKYTNSLLPGASAAVAAQMRPSNAPSAEGGSGLPAYQRLKSRIQVTNSNMDRLLDGTGGGPANTRASMSNAPAVSAAAAAAASMPSIPITIAQSAAQQGSSDDRSPRRHGSVSMSANPPDAPGSTKIAGSKLTSNSSHSTPRLSMRAGVQNDPNLMVSTVQPHPPPTENSGGRGTGEGIAGSSSASGRKSMRMDRTSSKESSGDGGGEGVVHPSAIVPGVPLMNKQTRESLKERLLI